MLRNCSLLWYMHIWNSRFLQLSAMEWQTWRVREEADLRDVPQSNDIFGMKSLFSRQLDFDIKKNSFGILNTRAIKLSSLYYSGFRLFMVVRNLKLPSKTTKLPRKTTKLPSKMQIAVQKSWTFFSDDTNMYILQCFTFIYCQK